jgi:hypothetical protein
VSDQHQWRCSCGDAGPWTSDREEAIRSGVAHAEKHLHVVHLETIGAFTGGNTAVTVSVGVDDAHIPGFEDVPTFTSAGLRKQASDA